MAGRAPRPPARVPVVGRPTTSTRTALPAPRSSLVGRELDAQHVVALLRYERVVTLTGVGGVGKTRLALRGGGRSPRPRRRRVVRRARAASPIPTTSSTPCRSPSAPAVPPAPTLAAATVAVSGGPGLLIVDNCEHVIDAAAAVVDALATACPELRIVATSREAARCRGRAGRRRAPAADRDGGSRAVPGAGGGGRRGAGRRPPIGDRGPVRPARRPAAGHRAGRGARGDARRGGDRRRPRRPGAAAVGAPRRHRAPRHDAGDHRVVVPDARSRRAAAVPASRRLRRRLRARRGAARGGVGGHRATWRPPATSSRSCTRAW